MAQPNIKQSLLVKRDLQAQLHRVTTHDGNQFLVKVAESDLGGEETLIEDEFYRLQKLALPYTLRPHRLSYFGERPAAYYDNEDGSPITLDGVAQGGDWDLLLQLVHDACAALRAFHERGLVLVGFSPKSFLRIARAPGLLVLDAPFAQELGGAFVGNENLWLRSPYFPYAAPEAIGSRSARLDPRTDIYSFGVVLYELLSGRQPFEGTEPAELIQSHLARRPRELSEIAPEVPQALSDLILQMLAKAPEDRLNDLDTFEQKLGQALAATSGSFPRYKRASEPPTALPSFSQELYGREDVFDALCTKLRRARTTPAIVIVSGDAGVGKTSLLRRLLEEEGIVGCRGKFDQSGPATPLSGWSGALRQLANAIITKPSEAVEAWRARLLDSLGDGAALLSGLVPEWEAILRWEGASVDTLEATLNRFALAIHRLFRCHAATETPLLLVLDDIQWADLSSLRILELLLTLPEPLNLLVVAAARSVESGVDQAALAAFERTLLESGVEVEHERLSPLSRQDLELFLRDSFTPDIEGLTELTDFVLARTDGNPFFAREFLSSLVERRALFQATSEQPWCWRRERASTIPPGSNVIDFLSRKVSVLPRATRDALRIGACLGPAFSWTDWQTVTAEATPAALEAAVTAGILESSQTGADADSRRFEFVHDRVFETCCSLNSAEERAELNLRIAQALRSAPATGLGDDRHYRLAGYFEAARPVMADGLERQAAAEVGLEAGKQAKSRGAFSQALEHLLSSLAFVSEPAAAGVPLTLPESVWQEHFEFTLSLHEHTAEAALLNGRFDLVYPICRQVLARAPTALRKVFAHDVLIRSYNGEKNFAAAADSALEILRDLGVKFPKRPTPVHVLYGFWRTRRRIFADQVAALADLPDMTDVRARAVAGLIQSVYSPAYLSRPALFPLIVFRHVDDSLEHGNQEYSGVTYNGFALVLAGFGDFERATALGQIGLRLLDRFPQAERLRAKAIMGHYTFIFPWKNHIRDTLPFYQQGLKSGLEHGDFEYAGFLMTLHTLAGLHSGVPLGLLDDECERYRAKIAALKQARSVLLQGVLSQIVFELRREAGATSTLAGPHCNERESLPQCLDPIDHNLLFQHYLAKLMLGVLLGETQAAREAASHGRKHLAAGAFALYIGPIFEFYEALAALILPAGDSRARKAIRSAARARGRLVKLCQHAPMNFSNKLCLIEAEAARLRGKTAEAAQHYDKAMELAQTHGFVHELALAQERAAAFYFERGMDRLGRHYLREAFVSYRRWGATAVLRRLQREHPQHFALLAASADAPDSGSPRRITESLDYRLLLKSSQAISGEILIPRLLERLLKAMLEHAAGQRGLLLLERRGELFIEAETDIDRQEVEFPVNESLESSSRLCHAIAYYVARTGKPVVLTDAANEGLFVDEPYVQKHAPRSILCSPIHYQGKLLGLVYLENNRVSHVFTRVRVELIDLLAGQAAISVANARFHTLKLEALQARINPHFLFNALSSIAELSVTNGATAETAILKLAHLYRYILDSSADAVVPLEQELQVVQDYLALEKLRFGAQLTFSVATSGDISLATIPGLLIQPLVENSIRHGVAPRLKPGNVWVNAVVGGTTCTIVVQDDGDGQKHATAGAGFGLRSVQERLELVYGKGFSLGITQRGGYRVEIEIPLRLPS